MVDKSKLSKDIEEQIQSLASDVYIQVEDKLTSLITAAVKAEISQTTDLQSKSPTEKEQTLANEVSQLKQVLAELQTDADVSKQNFQVELTQNSINHTETVERLEKEIVNLKKQGTQQQHEKQSSDNKLDEKLLETEQKLNDKTQEIDGLNGRIMVLTEQEQSLTRQLADSNTQLQATDKKQSEAVTAAKEVIENAARQKVDLLNEKIKQLESDIEQIKSEAEQSSDSKEKLLTAKITQLTEQIQQEQNGKAELQQQLSAMQKSIDTEQDKNKQTELKNQEYQAKIVSLTEQNATDKQLQLDAVKTADKATSEANEKIKQQHLDEIKAINEKSEQVKEQHLAEIKAINEKTEQIKQQHLDEIKVINESGVQAKQLQETAQLKIIELDKANEQLSQKIATEQNDVKLYQQEVSVLNEQVKVAQEGQENILQRFNSNRDKQEQENTKVRETIKFLRDENHQLISDNSEQSNQFNEKINELELKLTEYRLKFEYAQKQLAN